MMAAKRKWFVLPEAEGDDGEPTGQYLLCPFLYTGPCDLTGEDTYDQPDHMTPARGPFPLKTAEYQARCANK